jgi:hypothetical protein
MPWKVVSDSGNFSVDLFIHLRVSANMMLMPLPPSMNTFFGLWSPIRASITRAA